MTMFERGRVPVCGWDDPKLLAIGVWYLLFQTAEAPVQAMKRGIEACRGIDMARGISLEADEVEILRRLEKIQEFIISASPELGILELIDRLESSMQPDDKGSQNDRARRRSRACDTKSRSGAGQRRRRQLGWATAE